MTYYRAVQICGTVNSTVVRATLKNMTKFETFAFPLQYYQNGTNKFPQYIPIQVAPSPFSLSLLLGRGRDGEVGGEQRRFVFYFIFSTSRERGVQQLLTNTIIQSSGIRRVYTQSTRIDYLRTVKSLLAACS